MRFATSPMPVRNFGFGDPDDEPARSLRHGLGQKNTGHQRIAGEMTLEDRAGLWNLCQRLDGAARDIELDDPIDQLEVFEPHLLKRPLPQ